MISSSLARVSRRPHTFYEFFAGGGMARLGLGADWDCLFANDRDPVKAATYRANFGAGHFHEADVFDLSAADLPGHADLAWASSPCQDLSLAGGRAGLAGGRSSAFLGFWRLIEALVAEDRAPPIVVIENVAGLLTSNNGKDFAIVCQGLSSQGYRFGVVEIDAACFLPQSRRRILIVGARVAPEGQSASLETPAVRRAREALPQALQKSWIDWRGAFPERRNLDLAALLEADDQVAWRSKAQTDKLISLMNKRHRARLDEALSRRERRVGAVFRRVRDGVQRAEVRFDGVAGCLRTPRGGSSRQILIIAQDGICRSRLISPREAARLMGLPDSYRLPPGVTNALQVAGDGVAVPVVAWLAREILAPLLARGTEPTISFESASNNRSVA